MTPATTPSGQRDRRAEPVASDALSAELVVELYVTQRLSSVVIAERLGTSPRAVCEQLHRVGITPRGARSSRRALLPRELLVELYVERGLSSDAIARQVGCSSQAVREQLRRSAIPLRRWRARGRPPPPR